VPLAQWLRTSLKEMLLDTVLSDRALSRGYFKPESVRHMVSAHMSGSDEYQYPLWDLLLLERWQRMFIDGESVPVAPRPVRASN
jgi:asparagine synthase (glutamine-hydrolysing)